jgi:protocatechuate 3,4-dioxygenase beta subunit
MHATFEKQVGRREVVHALGSVVAFGFLAGCGGGESSPTAASTATTGSSSGTGTIATSNAACVVTPELTEGPYFVDEGLNRSDIRSDPGTGVARPGVPLDLTIALWQVSSGTCGSLAGALVDLWHCDALGVYSDVGAQGTLGQRFLRGYQVSDASGMVRFTTIYPGWYPGRAVHMHFKVRTNPTGSQGLEFTSQIFFDEALTDRVHAESPYNTKGRRDTLITTDGIYRGGGPVLLAPFSPAGGGYAGTFHVGVRA